jgi:hypothetical protein
MTSNLQHLRNATFDKSVERPPPSVERTLASDSGSERRRRRPLKIPMSALMRVSVSWDKEPPARSPFFIRNQLRSEISRSRAHASALVSRQISASFKMPSMAAGVSRSLVVGSARFGATGGGPGSTAGLMGGAKPLISAS